MGREDEILGLREAAEKERRELERLMPKIDVVKSSKFRDNDNLVLPEGFSGDLYDSTYDDAVKAYSEGNFDAAMSLCAQKDPQSLNARYVALVGNCYFKKHNQILAIEKWQKAIELNPSLAEPYINLGNIEYSKKNLNGAIKLWLTASSIKPESEAVNVNLGVAYGEKGLRYESLKYFEKFLKYVPESNSAKYNEIFTTMDYFRETAKKAVERAELALRENKVNQAVQYYMYAIENYPMQVKSPFALGNIFYNDNNYEKALYYWTLCRKSPKVPQQLILNMAKALDKLKKYDSAYCFYSRYLPIISTTPSEYNVVKSRLIQLSVTFTKSPLVIEAHKLMGEKAEEDVDYFTAIEEFENYMILAHKDNHELQKHILELKMCYNPESYLVGLLIGKIEQMKDNEIGEIIIPMCNRILMFAEPNSKEFMYANTKKNSIIRRGL